MTALINALLDSLRRQAAERDFAVQLAFWDGTRARLSGPTQRDSPVTLHLKRPAAVLALLRADLARLGRAYVEDAIDVEGPAAAVVRVATELAAPAEATRRRRLSWAPWRHSRRRDARAIAHHYDVSNAFYSLWLDPRLVYSCAYFRSDADTLEQAQEHKLDLICRKLQLQPGEHLLDIGCGWGALVLWAARHYGVSAVGVTLSENQAALARERVKAAGLEGRVEIRLQDYREIPEADGYDKIASVGMFEHVGHKNLPIYFGAVRRLLREGGLFLNHGITELSDPDSGVRSGAGDFIERYVFPEGELPTLAHAIEQMARQKLEVYDVEGLRPHYARTLTHWVERLEAQREAALALVPEATWRIWRVYLAGSALAFERGWISIHQVLATKCEAGPSTQPGTRDYLLS
ncbi:MAG: class I SAM-dependent methyltransferase [Pelomonas sp.]|nr:class I SAM-dependent methyltransferase [Roseateles sp.]